MAKMILFTLFIGSALAAPSAPYLSAPLYGPGPAVVASAPVLAAAPAVTAVHHPARLNTHLAPAAIAVQTPTLSGYSYTSEVRHDAPAVVAAPVAPLLAAPAPVYAAPAPIVRHAVAAAPLAAPVAPLFSKSYAVETGRLVAGHAVAAAPVLAAPHAPVLAAPAAPLLAAPAYWKGKA